MERSLSDGASLYFQDAIGETRNAASKVRRDGLAVRGPTPFWLGRPIQTGSPGGKAAGRVRRTPQAYTPDGSRMTTDRARPCAGRIGERRTIAKRSSNDDDGRASGSPAHSIGPGRCRSDSERPADDDGRTEAPLRRGFQEICRQRSEDFPISVFAALLKKAEPSADGAFSRFERGFHGLLEPLSLISRRQEDPRLLTTTENVLKASPAGAFSLLVSLSLSLSLSLSAD